MSSLLSFDRRAAAVGSRIALVHTQAGANNRNTPRMAKRASVELTPTRSQFNQPLNVDVGARAVRNRFSTCA
jgi:hypothetical protein